MSTDQRFVVVNGDVQLTIAKEGDPTIKLNVPAAGISLDHFIERLKTSVKDMDRKIALGWAKDPNRRRPDVLVHFYVAGGSAVRVHMGGYAIDTNLHAEPIQNGNSSVVFQHDFKTLSSAIESVVQRATPMLIAHILEMLSKKEEIPNVPDAIENKKE